MSVQWNLIEIDLPPASSRKDRYREFIDQVERPLALFVHNSPKKDGRSENSSDGKCNLRCKGIRICRVWKIQAEILRGKHLRFCTQCAENMSPVFTRKRKIAEQVLQDQNTFSTSEYVSSDEDVGPRERMKTCGSWKKSVSELYKGHELKCMTCKHNKVKRVLLGAVNKRKNGSCFMHWKLIKIDLPIVKFTRNRYQHLLNRRNEVSRCTKPECIVIEDSDVDEWTNETKEERYQLDWTSFEDVDSNVQRLDESI